MALKIITPYVDNEEIKKHKKEFFDYDIYYEQDTAGIGSDLMFQKMWNKFPNDDIFILHADMSIFSPNWLEDLLTYVDKYPEAGMFGCLLLYPAKNESNNYYIQSAGGRFTLDNPDHFGSGLIIESKTTFKKALEADVGQYDKVREVAWTTFGGCYIRRSFIDKVGSFSPEFEWTYNRDVDYCLTARSLGEKIYQVPVRLFHHESRDNKKAKMFNNELLRKELRNLDKLREKWSNSKFYKTLDKEI